MISPTTHLVVFTRHPKPGTTKTRLIPALGATGAASLQREMTEHMLKQADALSQQMPLSVSIHYTGGDRREMQQWLGQSREYLPQSSGDLGDRLVTAFEHGFKAATQVIAIGIDCPALDPQRLRDAFDTLTTEDAVLGPASDGGYYLIGIRKDASSNWAALFEGIDWGSDRVLGQTQASLETLNLSCPLLPVLTDVDYPWDLPQWQAVVHGAPSPPTETISIVMPVLNEAARIQGALGILQRQLEHAAGVEVIVVDGGSSDRTVELAQASGVTVISAELGRARQMNAGAAIAQGNILLFLHGDTQLPDRFVTLIRQTLLDMQGESSPIAGAFSLKICGEQPGLRIVEWGVQWRSQRWTLPYGDQALFVRANCFRAIGGFPDLPIMEDFEFVRQLKRTGSLVVLPDAVVTSKRRWKTVGIWQTTLINQLIVAGYLLGLSPEMLYRWYRRSPPPPSLPQPLQES
ncbi:MAG: TIGR04283 family arsenosugar biosynthesis glycosyltransferase [Elainellaceae cyanobacterium]